MKNQIFTWTDPLGKDHKIEVTITIDSDEEGFGRLTLSHDPSYTCNEFDGYQDAYSLCEHVADNMLNEKILSGFDFVAAGFLTETDWAYNQAIELYDQIIDMADAKLFIEYPELENDLQNHNTQAELSMSKIYDKYNEDNEG